MTVNDFIKRLKPEDYNKVIIHSDGEGWSNVWFKVNDSDITIFDEDNAIFSDDKI